MLKQVTLLIFILFVQLINAQTDTLHIHYFHNGAISTISYLNENREGKALAYNFEGEIIYEKNTRRIHGSASVSFSHYKNGMVHKANYSSYPDAGIQRYKSYTTFNENGERISEVVEEHDSPWGNRVTLPDTSKKGKVIEEQPIPKPKKSDQKPEIMVCAMIHENIIEVVNHSDLKIEVTLKHKIQDTTFYLNSGNQFNGLNYISSEISSPLEENVNISYMPKRKRKNVIHLIEEKKLSERATKHIVHLFESVAVE